ncbi:MAG: lipoyl(octanoyl) transferase LipB [Bdellovibrionales bacterium]|nr:lipoyl(octanoyl) transferase LipB [Bdellovibrionales bacterium]
MRSRFFGDAEFEMQNWGVVGYRDGWLRQKELHAARVRGDAPDTLIFCHHPPVITLGRASQRGERPVISDPNIEVVEIERGGQATWHGPGQVVVYPIMQLDKEKGFGVHGLIRALENWVIDYVGTMNLHAVPVEGATGAWIDGTRKIASIGIAVSHWVSYHGLAFNFDTGMEPWRAFNPCGFSSEVMTDLKKETGRAWTYDEVLRGLQARLS